MLDHEGLWSDRADDTPTMKGITLGTYTAWSKKKGLPVPTKETLRAIPDDHLAAIYNEEYWLLSKADKLAWPDSLAVMDLAVNGGVGRAQQLTAEVGTDAVRLTARRLRWYTGLAGWGVNGAGWVRRASDLLVEASKP